MLVVVLLGSLAAPGAVAGPDYQHPVDITMPVEGSYAEDFHAGRAGDRIHRATDIFNDMGTKVYAAMGGEVTWAPTEEHPTAGFALQIEGDDGRKYAYYHLGEAGGSRSGALAEGVDTGVRVERGQLIGYLGNSGNAVHTPPHLHFEIHDANITDPYGSNRLDPYASLRSAEERGDYPERDPDDPDDPGPDPDPPAPDPDEGYTVQEGDTLSEIARDHSLDGWESLLELNPDIDNPDLIWPGQILRTPTGDLYIVEEGDTLSEVAREHGFDGWESLLGLNPELDDPHLIFPAQELRVSED